MDLPFNKSIIPLLEDYIQQNKGTCFTMLRFFFFFLVTHHTMRFFSKTSSNAFFALFMSVQLQSAVQCSLPTHHTVI